jgi:hypothetical protein
MALLLLAGSSAHAQTNNAQSTSCWAAAIKGPVVVTMTDGSVQKGTLACFGATEVVLAGSGSIPIDSILRIDKPRDGILDGVLRGASVGVVMLALCAPHCTAGEVARVTAAYAAVGGILDAAEGNNTTIFRRGGPSPSLTWRIRF